MYNWKVTYSQGSMLYEKYVMGDIYACLNIGIFSGDIIKIEKVAQPAP